MLDLVDLLSEGQLGKTILQTSLAEIHTLTEHTRVFCVEEEG